MDFGWAFIGCGWIAETVAKELKRCGGGRIVSVYSRTRERTEKFVARFGGRACASLEEALSTVGVEGAYIALPHNLHAEFARRCLERGIPVLAEKPVTVNMKEAEELFALSRREGVYFSEAMWTWHNPVSRRVREWVKEGRCGTVRSVKATYAYPMIYLNRNPRLTSPALAGGALLDVGVYPLRYLYELFGAPISVACEGKLKGGVDLSETVTLDYGGFRAELMISLERFGGERLRIFGTEGSISVPAFHKAKRAFFVSRSGAKEKFRGETALYALMMRQVAEEIRAGRIDSGFSSAEATLGTMRLLDECRSRLKVVYPFEESFAKID